jgi:hypothetical protein
MKKIPAITTKIANETLQPYFDALYRELSPLSDKQRSVQIQQYKSYIESEAQKTKSSGIRMQLRINLHSMLEKLGEGQKQIEVNVRPKASSKNCYRSNNEAYIELFDASGLDLAP